MAEFYNLNGKKLQRQYRDYLSEFKQWKQKSHAKQYLIYPQNIGKYLSIDETALSKGELYTIITNKKAKGKKGAIVAICAGTKIEPIIEQLLKIPSKTRNKVKEITLDMANSMKTIARVCFPKATQVADRFHVQKLALEALQDIRIKHRWEAIDQENNSIKLAKEKQHEFSPEIFDNGDTRKQLLARSRYLLYKAPSDWTQNQHLRNIFNQAKSIEIAYTKLAQWYNQVENSGFKAFRSQFRSVKNVEFFLFRLTTIFA
ncbi:transposase [Seonamhaeicola sp. S2-3]|uniref:ISAon1 family transposase n=1 Tax=Seonamhaeicola sp. S2-3 TaxID=1936081 RepID=UPI0012F96AEC|nr:transposase [Seonamhaeicola sp. S2-3]